MEPNGTIDFNPLSYLILEKDANAHPMELLVLEPTTKFGHHLHLVNPLRERSNSKYVNTNCNENHKKNR